jgi:TetR/AcrR family transcriptional regulator
MENRLVILDCALKLFASRGYDAVGVQEIVEAAEVTKPTLYHYFGSKQGLLQALLEQNFSGLFGVLANATVFQGDLPLTLSRTAEAYFQFAEANPTFYRMQLSMSFSPVESETYQAVSGFQVRQYALLEEMFRLAANVHGNMIGRQKDYAATFLGMINTYITLALNGRVRLDDAQLYHAVHQFQHGIYS